MKPLVALLGWPLLLAFDWADDAPDAGATRDSLWTDDEPTDHTLTDHAELASQELAS